MLRDGAVGVATESQPRSIQKNGERSHFFVSLNREWLSQLGLAEKGTPTLHSVSVGTLPVVVQKPAIIVQPAEVISHD